MTRRKRLLIALGAVLVAVGGFFVWRSRTAPELPAIDLNGADPALVAAIDAARREVSDDPRSGTAWGNLGSVLAANGYTEQAATCFGHAARFDSDNPRWPCLHAIQYLNAGNPRDAIPRLKAAIAVAPKREERATLLFWLATVQIDKGDLDDAGDSLSEMAKIDPESPRLTFTRGLLLVGRGEIPAAREQFKRVAEHPSARKRVCEMLALYSDGDRASQQEQCGRLPPDQSWPNPWMADLMRLRVKRTDRLEIYWDLERSGRAAEARNYLEQLATSSPDAEVCTLLGVSRFTAGEYPAAAEMLKSALAFDHRIAKANLILGAALLEIGEKRHKEPGGAEAAAESFREAIKAEDRALALQANLANAHSIRGRAFRHLGKTDEALQAFREAITCQPETADLHRELGEALAESGKIDLGLRHLEDAVKLSLPDDTRTRDALAKWKK